MSIPGLPRISGSRRPPWAVSVLAASFLLFALVLLLSRVSDPDRILHSLASRPGPATALEFIEHGRVALREHRLQIAEKAFRRATVLDPKLAPAWMGLIWVHTAQMRRAEVLDEFPVLAELQFLDFDHVLVWTQVRCGIWDTDKVTEPLKACVANDPTDRGVRLALAEGLRQAGKTDESEALLEPLDDSDPGALVIRARLAIDRNDLGAVDSILGRGPADDAELAELRGQVALARHDAATAVSCFGRALAARPDLRRSALGLAQSLVLLGRTESRPAHLANLEKLDRLHNLILQAAQSTHQSRTNAPLLRDLGAACEALGYQAEARAWYRLAISRDPLDAEAQAALFHLGRPVPTPGPDRSVHPDRESIR
jgi:tetratricopeptide (TPR) repeat protein